MNTTGIIDLACQHPVAETASRLESLLKAKSLKIFSRIDQAAEAKAAGLTMRPMVLLIFGDPKTGTALMNRHPSIAMDLPLKALVWESAEGKVWLSYNSPEFLQQRHGLDSRPFEAIGNLLQTATQQVSEDKYALFIGITQKCEYHDTNEKHISKKVIGENRRFSMKAVGYTTTGSVDVLQDIELPKPAPGPRDLLVEVRAISVNPVDTKIRAGGGPGSPGGAAKILGWDAAGVVAAAGSEVTLFAPGDEVYYAGALDRSGSYCEYHLVDERLVGRKPASIGFAEAAALPLTTITAWEMLFDRLKIRIGKPANAGSLLIIGGAGGVGSIATQLARRLTGLTVIATASRPETQSWCRDLGAHYVIDHRQPIAAQVKAIVPGGVNYVLALTRTEDHFDQIVEAFAPQGALALIESPASLLDINKLKPKSLSLHWEFMFTRSLFQTADMGEQGRMLNEVAALVDAGLVRSTMNAHLGLINAANVKRAHVIAESGAAIGKVVLSDF
jgi:NADPH2:quinone reductase